MDFTYVILIFLKTVIQWVLLLGGVCSILHAIFSSALAVVFLYIKIALLLLFHLHGPDGYAAKELYPNTDNISYHETGIHRQNKERFRT